MKYLVYAIIVLVAGSMLYVGFFNGKKSQQNNDERVWETKTDDQPPVTIAITPIEFGKDTQIWKFNVDFTTHSGSLDDDPVKVASLMDDKGNTYEPTAWEGPGPGGHHRAGVLLFNAVSPAPEYITLRIRNVGGIAEREFRWTINN